MKAAMNSHVSQERHTMFSASAANVQERLSVMLEELEVDMNDKADEVYLAMRRDYNSVLGGGDVPQNGEILPKNQRLVRKEIMRIIDGVEKIFMKIAGLEVKDEDDEDKHSFPSNDGKDGGRVVSKHEEKDEDSKVKRETTSPGQSEGQVQQPKRESSSDESETSFASAETHERLDGRAKVDSSDSEGSESSTDSESS